MRKIYTSILLGCIGGLFIITGQMKGFLMTEGEKLIELWPFWLSGVTCVIGAVFIARKK